MALIIDILLLAVTIGCATVAGQDALSAIEKGVELVLKNQQQLFGELDDLQYDLDDMQAQFTCHYGHCKIQGKIKLTGSNIPISARLCLAVLL